MAHPIYLRVDWGILSVLATFVCRRLDFQEILHVVADECMLLLSVTLSSQDAQKILSDVESGMLDGDTSSILKAWILHSPLTMRELALRSLKEAAKALRLNRS